MNKYLSKNSKRLVLELNKLNISIPKNKLNNFKVLIPYHNQLVKKYSELKDDDVKISKHKSEIIDNSDHTIPCNTIKILLYIKNNKELQDEIYEIYRFTNQERESTKQFLNTLNKDTNFESCVSWINNNGTKISRSVYNLLKMKKIPDVFLRSMNILTDDIYGEFASLDIQHYIEKFIDSKCTFSVNFKNHYLDMDIKTREKIEDNLLKQIIKRCLILAYYHNEENHNTSPILMELLQTQNLKKLPIKGKLLGPREINSGSTSFGSVNKVCIWRDEECKKLIVHELVHYHDIDCRSLGDNINRIVSENFNIAPEIEKRLYEAYTESCANIFNCFICAYECDNKSNIELAKKMYLTELKYSIFQTAKILNFYGFKDIYDFVKKYDDRNLFQQSTSVFSYFFVKTAFLFNIDKFIDFIKKYSKPEITCGIKLIDNHETFNALVKLMITLGKDKMYLETLNNTMKVLKNTKIPEVLNQTLRMTCVEVN